MVEKPFDYGEWLKQITLVNIAKTSLLLFVVALQILVIVWIIQHMGTEDTPAPVTTTITETVTTPTP